MWSSRRLILVATVCAIGLGSAGVLLFSNRTADTNVVAVGTTAPLAAPEPGGSSSTTEPCHFPTTTPGGTVPEPLCEGADGVTDTEPGPDNGTLPPRRFVCPDDDYPIVMVATIWAPAFAAPESLPACGGGLWGPTDGVLLVPSEPLAGLDPDLSIGVALDRRPGGLDWSGTALLPASGGEPLIRFTSFTTNMPDGETVIAESIADLCRGGEPTVIRGSDGCWNGQSFHWSETNTRYEVAVSPGTGLESSDVAEWLETWRPI